MFSDSSRGNALLACALVGAGVGRAVAGEGPPLAVVTVDPPRHGLNTQVSASIVVNFDQPVDPASVNADSLWVFGRWSGTVQGTYSFSNGNQTVTLDPDDDFFFGEQVMVILSHDLQTPGGTTLRSAGYSWQFWTAAAPALRSFTALDVMSTRTLPGQPTTAYGAVATDLNGDRYADLTIVNEQTADLRVFLNLADGTGLYDDFLEPTFSVNTQASPSEPSDFDRDGNADICVANIATHSVSILLGNGDGTYGAQQEITVGQSPRGIAVLDVDGDGDIDIVNTNSSTSNMSLLVNDGNGVFGLPVFFEGGGSGEWALGAADMNDDAIMDLAIGARNNARILVNKGNGDGTFTFVGFQASGGATWMLNVSDVDGNGTEDVACVNSSTNTGRILLGDGNGALAIGQTVGTPNSFPLATDLGDLDGDGDLDWVTSSFAGDWLVYINDGSATFALDQVLPSSAAASCAIPVDIDNDGDLDLALIDELDDLVTLTLNTGTRVPGDTDGDGDVDVEDLLDVLGTWGPCLAPCPPFCSADVNFDCSVDVIDLLLVLGNWS